MKRKFGVLNCYFTMSGHRLAEMVGFILILKSFQTIHSHELNVKHCICQYGPNQLKQK